MSMDSSGIFIRQVSQFWSSCEFFLIDRITHCLVTILLSSKLSEGRVGVQYLHHGIVWSSTYVLGNLNCVSKEKMSCLLQCTAPFSL